MLCLKRQFIKDVFISAGLYFQSIKLSRSLQNHPVQSGTLLHYTLNTCITNKGSIRQIPEIISENPL